MEEKDYDEQYRLLKKVAAKWKSIKDEYFEFERVENKRSQRPDLHAMLLLEELFPTDNNCDMVSAAEHDEIFFDVDEAEIATLSNEHILELIRSGISYNDENDCLSSLV